MASGADRPESGLTPGDRERLRAFRDADGLADLVALTDADDEHAAYLAAKREWRDLRRRELATRPASDGLPGTCVSVDGHAFHVHGVTHADTDAERDYLREHVDRFFDRGAVVYCEQGIRPMYFADRGGACEMDDYRWAMAQCADLDAESHAAGVLDGGFDGLAEDLDDLTGAFRDAAFSLIDAGGSYYGDGFKRALGDVASDFLTSHADLATGDEFEAFALTHAAAEDPDRLVDLQRYYERTFLPQPIEREWLRRHDPELELVTHARNERMADYAVYHNETVEEVHLIVGAAHQPGVRYYLERFRDGERELDGFELA